MRLCQGSRFPRVVQVNLITLLLMASSAAEEPKPVAAPNGSADVNASLNELQSAN